MNDESASFFQIGIGGNWNDDFYQEYMGIKVFSDAI